MKSMLCKTPKNDQYEITRIFDVPREALWKTLTTERWKSWWLPRQYKLYDAELRPGGHYYGCFEQLDGREFCVKGKVLEVIPNEKLVLSDTFADRESIIAPADYYSSVEEWPPEMTVTATFEDLNGSTMLTVKHSGLKGSLCGEIEEDWNHFFDELDREIKKEMKGEYSKALTEDLKFKEEKNAEL